MDEGACPMTSQRTDVLGVPVDAVDMELALDRINAMLAGNETQIVLAVNPEKVMAAQQDPLLLRALASASLLIPDGIGIVLATRLLHGMRMKRVPGSDLMPEICRIAALKGKSVFLFGAKPGVAEKAASLLQRRYPNLQVAGSCHGYWPEEEMDVLVQTINRSGAAVLFVGLGSPRQEYWLARHQGQLGVQVCQAVGGTFDAICGNPRRAPQWVQRIHMEWLHRLVVQPSRVNRQSALPKFVKEVLRQAKLQRRRN